MTNRYTQLTVTEDEFGAPITILAIEGSVNDVACYAIGGEHDDADYVLQHGRKMSERAASANGATWPARLTYRR